MSQQDAYTPMLRAMAAQVGVDAAQLAQSQALFIKGVEVVLSQVGNALQCACEVAHLTPQPPAGLLQLLLQANTLGRPTQGGTLGWMRDRGVLVLAKQVPLDAPAALAVRTCLEMAATSKVWAAALSAPIGDTGQPMA